MRRVWVNPDLRGQRLQNRPLARKQPRMRPGPRPTSPREGALIQSPAEYVRGSGAKKRLERAVERHPEVGRGPMLGWMVRNECALYDCYGLLNLLGGFNFSLIFTHEQYLNRTKRLHSRPQEEISSQEVIRDT